MSQNSEERARLKDLGRENRLSFRNYAEHQLRLELKEKAMDACSPEVRAFAQCAEEKGLMVVFACKTLHRQVQDCLREHNSDERWQAYKEEHKDLLDRKAHSMK